MTLPHDETRARLIRVTLDLMDHGGIEAVKARPVANRVGVSVGTVYNLFGSIDGLVQEANAHVLEDFATYALARIRETDSARDLVIAEGGMDPIAALEDRLLTMASAYVDYVEANESRWAAMLSITATARSASFPTIIRPCRIHSSAGLQTLSNPPDLALI
ncbi:MAG: TetR/AcrR family transcriptional regulator [Nitratireductor sp.]